MSYWVIEFGPKIKSSVWQDSSSNTHNGADRAAMLDCIWQTNIHATNVAWTLSLLQFADDKALYTFLYNKTQIRFILTLGVRMYVLWKQDPTQPLCTDLILASGPSSWNASIQFRTKMDGVKENI